MDGIKIEQANDSQIDDVYSIIQACAVDMQNKGKNNWITYYNRAIIEGKFEHGKVFILYIDGTPVATVSLSTHAPDYYTDNEEQVDYTRKFIEPNSDKAYYRSALAVHPDYQNQKLGKRLIEMTEEFARKNGFKYIRFDTRNKELLGFYDRNGYKVRGEVLDEDVIYYLVEKDLEEA